MPFVPVPKDLTKVKTKIALNLTKRQLICFGLGALVGIPVYLLTHGMIGNESAVLLMIGLMMPFFTFGIYEKDGQPLEKVLYHFIRASFLTPQTRPYRTENLYAALMRQNKYEKEVTAIENKAAAARKKSRNGKKPAKTRQGGAAGHSAPAQYHPDGQRKAAPCRSHQKGQAGR